MAAGDLDGDGRTDAAFAAPTANGSAGAVHLAFGRPAGAAEIDLSAPDGLSSVRIDGLAAGDALGDALEIGDVNGDAIADLVVAATGAGGPGREGAGVVYVVFGQAGGWDPVIDLGGPRREQRLRHPRPVPGRRHGLRHRHRRRGRRPPRRHRHRRLGGR